MIKILLTDGQSFTHLNGDFANGDESWLSVHDSIGATIAMYPKDRIVRVMHYPKAGETTGSDADSEDGHSKGQT